MMPSSPSRIAYIDGMRAIAVALVLFYHAHIPGFRNGFLGVDVFFVISGFLITSIILRERAEGVFSIAKFYMRRVRRILPALYVVLIFTVIVSWFVLLPVDYSLFGRWITSGVLMVPNMFAWSNLRDGYFAVSSEEYPLLHLWSLGVEEQFYIVFPITLVLLSSFVSRGRVALVFALGFIASIGAAVWGEFAFPSAAFYFLATRAWEILLGCMVAMAYSQNLDFNCIRCKSLIARCVSALSILFLVLALLLNVRIAGFYVLAQALVVFGVSGFIYIARFELTPVHRALGWRPLVSLGLISYSLYLVHWPIFALLRYRAPGIVDSYWVSVGVCLFSVVLAILINRYIELPMLRLKAGVLGVIATAAFALLGAGLLISVNKGFPERFDQWRGALALEIVAEKSTLASSECLGSETNPESLRSILCAVGSPQGSPQFLLWGDSHATMLAPVFDILAREKGIAGVVASRGASPAIIGAEFRGAGCSLENERLQEWQADLLKALRDNPSITDVYIVGRWSLYSIPINEGDLGGCTTRMINMRNGTTQGLDEIGIGLTETVKALQKMGRKVFVVAMTPEVSLQPISSLRNPDIHIDPASWRDAGFPDRRAVLRDTFTLLEKQTGAKVLYPEDVLCDKDGGCLVASGTQMLYSDDTHLTRAGSLFLLDMFRESFRVTTIKPTTLIR